MRTKESLWNEISLLDGEIIDLKKTAKYYKDLAEQKQERLNGLKSELERLQNSAHAPVTNPA